MSRPPLKVDAELEESLRRIGGALDHNRDQYAAMVEEILSATGARVAGRIAARAEEAAARVVEGSRPRVRGRRDERRRKRMREEEADEADLPKGIVFAVVAIVCLLFGLVRPQFFWMLFVALGFGLSAASSFGRAAKKRRLERESHAEPAGEAERTAEPVATGAAETPPPASPAAEPPDPKVVRIQSLCDKLLAELESGPPIVREVVTEPHATIGGLRQACLETARRERELRSVLAAQDEAELVTEREALAARLSTESDAIVRDRLGQALGALDQQLAHRAELATAATRLEAENTRILYTLENLHMQLLRARSTDIGAPELGGKLRASLRELGTQIEAVAEALEWADAPTVPDREAATPHTSEAHPAPGASATSAERERAEREAAARRAAQAREAQRH